MSSEAFKERLQKESDAATRRMLKDLGFEKTDDLKTVIATAKTLSDEKKTEAEKAAARIKELEPKAARADTLAKRFEAQVSAEFDKLPEKMREAIDKVAVGDAEKRADQMQVLRDAGLLDAAPPGPPKPAPPREQGAPPGPTPPPTNARTPYEEHEHLVANKSPMASTYFAIHAAAIARSRPADK
jgi:hypothetical protein